MSSSEPTDIAMTSGRWQRIEEIFYAALERSDHKRGAFLDGACGDDASLRTEVESLLAASDDSARIGGVVAEGAHKAMDRLANIGPADVAPPERIGPYRILEEVGRGGLGTVYLAERDDEHYAMRVAIKLVRRGLDTEDILARLRHERQILARLEHPNITRLLDGGSTPEGQPYLVMEYVEGTTLETFCDQQRLSVRKRLRLMIDICAAVGFAHQSLVIHRDIKPSNILVKDDGTVKLLDFGIAKLLDRDAETAAEPTTPGFQWLTPEYASPEQVRGLPLTTSTDIYSLGVMLYRLLAGLLPYDRHAANRDDVAAADVVRPSDRLQSVSQTSVDEITACRDTRPARLRQELRGDLDNIVLKAMASESSERYGSVSELADDLHRFLENRPVRARPVSLALRWAKFIRRHRLAMVAASLVLLSLLGGLASTLWQARIARQALGRAEAALDLLQGIFERSEPNVAKGEELTVRQFLEEGALVIGQMEGQPELRSVLMHFVGRIYRNIGSYDAALRLQRDALAMRRQLFGKVHPLIAESLVATAEVHNSQGDFVEAETLLLEALEMRRQIFGHEHLAVAEVLSDLGVALRHLRRWDEAKEILGEAIEMRRRLLGDDHIDTARSLNNLAVVHLKLGEVEQAEPILRWVLEVRRRVLGDDHSETLGVWYNLAVAMRRRGDLEGSEAALRDILVLRRKSLGDDHVDIAATLNSLGRVLALRDEVEEATGYFGESVAMFNRALGSGSRISGIVSNNLGDAWLRAGDSAAAEQTYQEALSIHRSLDAAHPETARALEGLGSLLCLEAGRWNAAEAYLGEALDLRRRVHGPTDSDRWRVQVAKGLLGRCLLNQGRLSEAEALLIAAYEELRQQLGEEHEKTLEVGGFLQTLRSRVPSAA